MKAGTKGLMDRLRLTNDEKTSEIRIGRVRMCVLVIHIQKSSINTHTQPHICIYTVALSLSLTHSLILSLNQAIMHTYKKNQPQIQKSDEIV